MGCFHVKGYSRKGGRVKGHKRCVKGAKARKGRKSKAMKGRCLKWSKKATRGKKRCLKRAKR